ncbi:SPOR domain-containing protein [Pseudoduganella sp. LjRoot289]|uniref:SPOR domain-containing protein n=1 Tax=Pseudoduganella sp. LjRoot289 TaxID=3342314 RepID=UPI003ECC22DC
MSFRSRPTSLHTQQGNTLLGIIIGLVIGLVIAVIVALVISKGSTPFTDKSGKVGKAAEPTAGQISDPNKPMYGSKEAAREAARDFSRDQNAATPATPVTARPAPATPAAKPVDELQQVVDKIEAASKTKPGATNVVPTPTGPAAAAAAPAPAAAAAGDDKFVYYLQAGAFREVADAENTRAKLALLGFEATVTDRTTDTGVLHRVRVGPYNQVETMNKVRSKLSENGIDVAVVRNQK